MSIQIFPDRQTLIESAAAYTAELAVKSIRDSGRFTLALSGGNTPRPVYARLTQPPHVGHIDWSRVHIFFGDERCVPRKTNAATITWRAPRCLTRYLSRLVTFIGYVAKISRKALLLSISVNSRLPLAAAPARERQTHVSTSSSLVWVIMAIQLRFFQDWPR